MLSPPDILAIRAKRFSLHSRLKSPDIFRHFIDSIILQMTHQPSLALSMFAPEGQPKTY